MIKKILLFLVLLFLTACQTRPTIELTYDPSTNAVHYLSTKDVSISYSKNATGELSLSIKTDATAGAEAQAKSTAGLIDLVNKVLPVVPRAP